jgi:hypothetical protein
VFALVVTGITHLLKVLHVSLASPTVGAVASMMPGSSSLGTEGVEPSSKRARPWSLLLVSSWDAHGVGHQFTPLSLLLFLP